MSNLRDLVGIWVKRTGLGDTCVTPLQSDFKRVSSKTQNPSVHFSEKRGLFWINSHGDSSRYLKVSDGCHIRQNNCLTLNDKIKKINGERSGCALQVAPVSHRHFRFAPTGILDIW